MVEAVEQLLVTPCSPLEGSVEPAAPDDSLLQPLLAQLEALQALWSECKR